MNGIIMHTTSTIPTMTIMMINAMTARNPSYPADMG